MLLALMFTWAPNLYYDYYNLCYCCFYDSPHLSEFGWEEICTSVVGGLDDGGNLLIQTWTYKFTSSTSDFC